MRTFFHPELPAVGSEFILSAGESLHAIKVIRLAPGDPLELLDGRGNRGTAELLRLDGRRHDQRAVCRLQAICPQPLPKCRLTLYIAPPRAKHLADCLRSATEMGVWRIVPILCQRSVARPDATASAAWQAEAIAAIKQSGNAFLPTIEPPVDFVAAVPTTPALTVVGDPAGSDAADLSLAGATKVGLWIGPEGGFAPAEHQALVAAGAQPVRLGRWTMRVETALPAMLGWLFGKGMSS